MGNAIRFEGQTEQWQQALQVMVGYSPAGAYKRDYSRLVLETAEVFLLDLPESPDSLALINGYGKSLVAQRVAMEGVA